MTNPHTAGGIVRNMTAHFDTSLKFAATQQLMETNELTFDQATELLGYQHGVDFLLVINKETSL